MYTFKTMYKVSMRIEQWQSLPAFHHHHHPVNKHSHNHNKDTHHCNAETRTLNILLTYQQ